MSEPEQHEAMKSISADLSQNVVTLFLLVVDI